MDNLSSSHNRDFRSTFFTMKQSHGHYSKDKDKNNDDADSVKVVFLLFRQRRHFPNIKIWVRKITLREQNKKGCSQKSKGQTIFPT